MPGQRGSHLPTQVAMERGVLCRRETGAVSETAPVFKARIAYLQKSY